jgi:hypothetical protein
MTATSPKNSDNDSQTSSLHKTGPGGPGMGRMAALGANVESVELVNAEGSKAGRQSPEATCPRKRGADEAVDFPGRRTA